MACEKKPRLSPGTALFHRDGFEANLLHEEWRSERAPVCAGPSLRILIHDFDELPGELDVRALAAKPLIVMATDVPMAVFQSTRGTITSC